MEHHVHCGLSNLIDDHMFYNDYFQISNLQNLSNPNQKVFFFLFLKLNIILALTSACQNCKPNPTR